MQRYQQGCGTAVGIISGDIEFIGTPCCAMRKGTTLKRTWTHVEEARDCCPELREFSFRLHDTSSLPISPISFNATKKGVEPQLQPPGHHSRSIYQETLDVVL